MRLEGKVAIITGAGSGMGRAMANQFAAEGAKVVAAEWNQATLDEVVAEVKAAGGEITGVQGDVSKLEDCQRIVDAATASYGKLDVLCNNAGVMDNFAPVGEFSDDILQRVFSINVYGPMYLSRLAIPLMEAQGGGSIVVTASVAGIKGGAAGVVYTSSKHAVVGMTRNIAAMYATKGIRCNAIAAGGVETNIMASVDPTKINPAGAERCQFMSQIIPGMLKAKDIADLALFLASDESKMVSGAIIPADAGWSAI